MFALLVMLAGAWVVNAGQPSAPAYNLQTRPSYGIATGLASQESFYSGYTVPLQTVSTPTIVIPVIGDIGRTGGLQSVNQANPGCPTFTGPGAPGNYFGYPASALDAGANFGGSGNTDDDIAGSFQAQQTASILNGVCAGVASTTPCTFVLNTGDNFYQCGADDYFNPAGFPLANGSTAMNTRLYTDWYSFYQTPTTPAIQNLPWYSTIGNHDLPTPGGVDLEIAYDRQGNFAGQPYYPIGQNWNLPARYYSVDYVSSASAASVRVINLDTNACNADYVNKVGKAMYALSAESLKTITYDYIASQMTWFNNTLISAVTTGCGGSGCANVIVMSHYSLYGTDQGFGNLNSNSPTFRKPPSSSAGNWTAGSLGVFNCYGQIQNIMNQQGGLYAPDVWVNGHDHTNAISFSSDYNTTAGPDTIFVTSGTGSLWQGGDGYPAMKGGNLTGVFPSIPGSAGAYPYNVAFSSPSPDGSVANGGVSLITITATSLTVDTYVTQNGPQIPAAGAPCDIAAVANANGVSVWSASGALNWTAVVAAGAQPIGDGTTLTCNICMNTSTPAVCGQTNWTTVPGATPSGYITSSVAYTAPIKAHTCTSTNGLTTSCKCNVAGYPAAGFIATGSSGFSICQNISAGGFVALANTVAGYTAPPMGVQGTLSPTWMGSALYATAGPAPVAFVSITNASAYRSVPVPSYNYQILPASKSIAGGLASQESFYSGYTVPLQTVSTPTIVIPVIGDIGRTGGLQSVNQANPGCPTFTGPGAPGNYFGYPASALDAGANFGGSGNTDDDIAGSFQAQQTASILNGVCAGVASTTPCTFVLNTGDNFYQCGADDYFNPAGFPLANGSTAMNTRLYTDWYSFYQTPTTPAIQNLPWYSTIGNHDLPTPGGVDLEIAYDRQGNFAGQPYYPIGQNWNLPARYYSVDYVSSASAASVRVINLDTNACNADYVNKVGKAMYALSAESLKTITYDYIASQMTWFNNTLISAVTTGCGGSGCANVIVMSHYSLYGTDQGFGNLNSNSPTFRKPPSSSAGNWTAGSLGVFNCYGQIQNIMNQQGGLYAPDVWVNGHDHTNAISFSSDYNTTAGPDTIFVTSGTGSLWQGGDGYPAMKGGNLTGVFPSIPGSAGAYPYNVAFSSPSPDGSVANGGVSLITITATSLTVDTYVTQNGPQIPAAGAPCDIAAVANANGVSVWSASGALNWTAVVAAGAQPIGDGTTLTCNICMNTSTPAVCGQTNWTTVPGATPSGYITSSVAYTAPIKAHTCTSTNGLTTSCKCNVAGYPAAGFIATGSSGFSICQNISAGGFVALANTVAGYTAPPMGVQGTLSPTWMGSALYAAAGPAPPAVVIVSASITLSITPSQFTGAVKTGFVNTLAVQLNVYPSAITITAVTPVTISGRHLLQNGVTVSFQVTTTSTTSAAAVSSQIATITTGSGATAFATALAANGVPVPASGGVSLASPPVTTGTGIMMSPSVSAAGRLAAVNTVALLACALASMLVM